MTERTRTKKTTKNKQKKTPHTKAKIGITKCQFTCNVNSVYAYLCCAITDGIRT